MLYRYDISSCLQAHPPPLSLSLSRSHSLARLACRRIPSFRNILVALTASILPMLNAFFLVCLVIAIYAIVAVSFFADVAPDNFAYFDVAFFSLFQVLG